MAGSFVQETAVEFSASGDFDGDGTQDVLIVDKVTGLYRLGYGTTTAGAYAFADGRPSGMESVTGLAAGRINGTTKDSMAVTTPAMNRVHVLSPAAPGYVEPRAVLDAGLGPQLLAAIDIAGGASPTAEDDLCFLATLDLTQGHQLRQIRSNAGAWSLLRFDDVPDAESCQGNPVVPHTGAMALFACMRDDGATSSFHAWSLTGTTATEVLSTSGLASGTRYISGIFDGPDANVLFWVPGQSSFQAARVVASGPAWTFAGVNTVSLSKSVAQLVTVKGLNGVRILIRYEDGSMALHAYTHSGGLSPALPIVPTGASGILSGVVAMGDNGFQLLCSDTPGGTTSRMITFQNDGGGWTQKGITNLPALRLSNRFANVFLLDHLLFRGSDTSVIHSYQAGDWVTQVTEAGGGPFTITADVAAYGGTTQGIGASSPVVIGSTSTESGGAAVNQMAPQFSIVSFAANLGPAVNPVTISPAPGTYANAQQITFSGLLAGTTVYYRKSGSGNFAAWNPADPPWVTRPTTVEYYASGAGGASATLSARYEFSVPPAQQDSDGDGAPDFVELAYGMDPAGGDDADADGFGDLDELAAGTNPNDAGSKPASLAVGGDSMLVDVRVQTRDLAGNTTGVAAPGTAFHVLDPFQNELGAGVANQGGVDASFGRARLRGVNSRMGFMLVRSAQNYDVVPAGSHEPRGREMLGLLPALEPESWNWSVPDGGIGMGTLWAWGGVNFQPGSTNWDIGTRGRQGMDPIWSVRQLNPLWDSSDIGEFSAAGWVAELQAAMNRGAQPYAQMTLTPGTTLEAIIFGHLLGTYMQERVFVGESLDGASFDFGQAGSWLLWRLRRPDIEFNDRSVVRIIALLRHIDTEINSGHAGAQALRRLARDVYLQHQALEPDHLGDMPTPIRALEGFVRDGELPASYLSGTALSLAELAAALARLNHIRDNAPMRQQVTRMLYVRDQTTPPGLALLESASGTPCLLLDANLRPLNLPTTAEAPAGTAIEVTGYEDMPLIGGYNAIEVISLSLDTMPFFTGVDSDGDLLADVWEYRHFGSLAFNGFDNADGSLYSLAQEYLEGTDPLNSSDNPPGGPVALEFLSFEMVTAGGVPQLRALWPERYAGAVEVLFEISQNLTDWEALAPLLATDASNGWFTRNIAFDAPRKFFRPLAQLKR